MYRDVVDPSFTWTNFSVLEQDALLLSKRSNNELNTLKLSTMYPQVPTIKVAILACLEKIARLKV